MDGIMVLLEKLCMKLIRFHGWLVMKFVSREYTHNMLKFSAIKTFQHSCSTLHSGMIFFCVKYIVTWYRKVKLRDSKEWIVVYFYFWHYHCKKFDRAGFWDKAMEEWTIAATGSLGAAQPITFCASTLMPWRWITEVTSSTSKVRSY